MQPHSFESWQSFCGDMTKRSLFWKLMKVWVHLTLSCDYIKVLRSKKKFKWLLTLFLLPSLQKIVSRVTFILQRWKTETWKVPRLNIPSKTCNCAKWIYFSMERKATPCYPAFRKVRCLERPGMRNHSCHVVFYSWDWETWCFDLYMNDKCTIKTNWQAGSKNSFQTINQNLSQCCLSHNAVDIQQ